MGPHWAIDTCFKDNQKLFRLPDCGYIVTGGSCSVLVLIRGSPDVAIVTSRGMLMIMYGCCMFS